MRVLTVVKVGGSLARGPHLRPFCRVLPETLGWSTILVVPGGGILADSVRSLSQRWRLSDATAHRMAILAMEQYGLMLTEMIPDARPVTDVHTWQRDPPRAVAVWLPARALADADSLPHTWDVTSDSIAAWVAGQLHADRLVLVKMVDGIRKQPDAPVGMYREISLATLRTLVEQGTCTEVDAHFPTILREVSIETWIVNGAYPERFRQLLQHGYTRGTRIIPHMPD